MLIILIDRSQVLSYLIRMPLLIQANHAIWQKSWSTNIDQYRAHCFSMDFGSECLQRRKKSLSVFVLDSKTKEDDKIVLQRVGFEISRERQGLLLQSRKMVKRWQSPWKTHWNNHGIEFHEFLSERSGQAREVPHHIKIGRRSFLKVYCSGKEALRRTPGSGWLSIFPGKSRTFRKCIE